MSIWCQLLAGGTARTVSLYFAPHELLYVASQSSSWHGSWPWEWANFLNGNLLPVMESRRCQAFPRPQSPIIYAAFNEFKQVPHWFRHKGKGLHKGVTPSRYGPSVQLSSVAESCPTLCDPMNRSMPGLPVHHQLPEFTQTHAHEVSDAIQPSHPLSFPSPPAPSPSQHQGLFQWVNSSHEVAKVLVSASGSVLPMNTQDWSPLGWTGWISLQSKGLSRVFSNTTVQKHQFFGAQLSSQSNSHIRTRSLEKP